MPKAELVTSSRRHPYQTPQGISSLQQLNRKSSVSSSQMTKWMRQFSIIPLKSFETIQRKGFTTSLIILFGIVFFQTVGIYWPTRDAPILSKPFDLFLLDKTEFGKIEVSSLQFHEKKVQSELVLLLQYFIIGGIITCSQIQTSYSLSWLSLLKLDKLRDSGENQTTIVIWPATASGHFYKERCFIQLRNFY